MGITSFRCSLRKLWFIPVLAMVSISFSTHTRPDSIPKGLIAASLRHGDAKWTLDRSKSSVGFNVTHMVVSEVEGGFKTFNGSMEYTRPDFSDAKIEFNVEVKSINTNNESRDKHLRSEDFLFADKYPLMRFVSSSFVHGDGSSYKLTGNLTIRNVTKPVTFDVSYGGISSDQRTAVFDAKTTIDRFDYELRWSKMTEAGGLVVSKDINIIVKAAFRVR